jgi:hypothetical protein
MGQKTHPVKYIMYLAFATDAIAMAEKHFLRSIALDWEI